LYQLKSEQLRQLFLDFFKEKEHTIVESSSLIPHGDPTLLLTSAGMVQFKPYFTGEETPSSKRLVSCQKCFRATDIETVGDSAHLTFFEMLGNFSVGDYFKKEAVDWGWEFVTRRLKLDIDKLWITIYLNDDEAFDIWRAIGIPAERILRYGEKENFWGPAGDSGPCGPCSEIHYDFGESVGCGRKDCAPDCDCGRFCEIWNLVFVQYFQDKEGKRTPLPRPSIDTGMGLERTAAVMQGVSNVYETDLFKPLMDKMTQITGARYGEAEDTDTALRITTEHGRGITFLIADGVLPSNEGRGYVLRRLLRRAVLFGKRLGLSKPFLTELAEVTVNIMGDIYPELKRKSTFILEVIEAEETRFDETINSGLEMLDEIIGATQKRAKSNIIAAEAFKLYDTYGFPVELTSEIARQQGFSVDMEGFAGEMEKQRNKSREAHRFKTQKSVTNNGTALEATTFNGYDCLEQQAVIRDIVGGERGGIVLDKTPFYAEKGGQTGDIGVVEGANGVFNVTDTVYLNPRVTLHRGRVTQGKLDIGETVKARVDKENRDATARNHTATHLLQAALRKTLGEHVQQHGSVVESRRLRFDFSHLKAMTESQIKQVEKEVNAKIRKNLSVVPQNTSYKEALAGGATALFGEKYGEEVRLLKIGEPVVSAELCGGTHVKATGELGFFHIVSEGSIGAGLRRIEAVSGADAEQAIEDRLIEMAIASGEMKKELAAERKKLAALEKKLSQMEAVALLAQAKQVKDVLLLVARVGKTNPDNLRQMADYLRDKLGSTIIVLGTVHQGKPFFLSAVTEDLVKKGYKAGDIIKRIAGIAGGGGGGKAALAQGGGKDIKKLEEALKAVEAMI
jgi:alanyl-tRNA synthetase